jgi:hypothetical protein
MYKQVIIPNCIQSLRIVDRCTVCNFCGEPFKECDTFYMNGVYEIGAIDVIQYLSEYYHVGCLIEQLNSQNIFPEIVKYLTSTLEGCLPAPPVFHTLIHPK